MLLLAHRGASADAPENTLPAFAEAVRQGADGVELDAMVCGSGEVVVCHDEDLLRLGGISTRVAQTPLWKLERTKLRVDPCHTPAGVPSLEAVLDLLPEDFLINIELKCGDVNDRGLALKVGALVTRRGMEARVLVSSFNPLCLWRLGAAYPTLRRGYLLAPDRPWFTQARVVAPLVSTFSIHPCEVDCTPRRVSEWRAGGLEVAAWTVDSVARARALEAMGVRYCITNRPRELRDGLGAPA